jgi:hypothetical protein
MRERRGPEDTEDKQSPRAPKRIGDPRKATGISNRPRGEEEEEQRHVHPRGQATSANTPKPPGQAARSAKDAVRSPKKSNMRTGRNHGSESTKRST